MLKIKKGDTVKVIAGKDNGKEGKVINPSKDNQIKTKDEEFENSSSFFCTQTGRI